MTQENKFNLDVEAEQKAFAPAIKPANNALQIETTAQASDPLPPSILFTTVAQPSPQLPSSVTYVPSKVDVSHNPEAQTADVRMNLKIKFDAEQSYNHLKKTMDDVQETLASTVNQIQTKWIPEPRAINSFEEKPTLEQTNLIFDSRMEKFSEYPRWA